MAQGHAIIITETNASIEKARPIPPKKNHAKAEIIAMPVMVGTKYDDILSASL
jgi:hypothetical protein